MSLVYTRKHALVYKNMRSRKKHAATFPDAPKHCASAQCRFPKMTQQQNKSSTNFCFSRFSLRVANCKKKMIFKCMFAHSTKTTIEDWNPLLNERRPASKRRKRVELSVVEVEANDAHETVHRCSGPCMTAQMEMRRRHHHHHHRCDRCLHFRAFALRLFCGIIHFKTSFLVFQLKICTSEICVKINRNDCRISAIPFGVQIFEYS